MARMGLFANSIAHNCLFSIRYAEILCQSVPEDSFARMPLADLNSAAFCIGHLSIYPTRIASLLGQSGALGNPAGWEALFKAGTPCVDQGSYPSKEALMAHYMSGYQAIAEMLMQTDDTILADSNPLEGPIRERFPLTGNAVEFLCIGHQTTHLGQVSAWRRVMGLGSAM